MRKVAERFKFSEDVSYSTQRTVEFLYQTLNVKVTSKGSPENSMDFINHQISRNYWVYRMLYAVDFYS